MTVTVTNMHHHPHVYMRRPNSRQALRRWLLVVLGAVLIACVLFWVMTKATD